MIKVRNIQGNGYQGTCHAHAGCLQEMCHSLLPDGFHQIGDNHKQNGEQEIVGHLHMIGIHLEGGKNGRQKQSPQVFTPIGKHDTRYHRRQIGQCPYFPDVAGSNDDKEIGRECPYDGTQHRHPATEIECPHQDIEAQQIYKNIPHILRQPEMIGIDGLHQWLRTAIRRSHLISRHAAEKGVRPARHLARSLPVLHLLLTGTYTGRRIVAIQDLPFNVCRKEIGKRNQGEEDENQHLRQNFLNRFHLVFLRLI